VNAEGNDEWLCYISSRDTPAGARRGTGRVDLTAAYAERDTVTIVISSIRPTSATIVEGRGVRARPRRRLPGVRVNPEAARLAPTARVVVAGRPGGRLAAALPRAHDEILPGSARGPQVAGRSAAALPYLGDPALVAYSAEMLHEKGGAGLRRRTFTAGWALALDEEAFQAKRVQANRDQGRQLISELEELNALYGSDTELLLRVTEMRGRPGLRAEPWLQMKARLREAAPVLLGMPPSGALRNDLMHALLSRTIDNLHGDVTRWLLPVAPRLAQVYEPELRLEDLTLHELLFTREGVRRLGLLGRLATALPEYPVQSLLAATGRLDQPLVDALLDVPAPSLQFLVGRLGSAELFAALRPFIDGPDLDLLGQYTPTAWRLLLEGLRQPDHLAALGLGWALVVERDPQGAVDARVLLEIARRADIAARYAVRALLDVPAGEWPGLLAAPDAAAAWLRAFGRLDVAPVLAAFPGIVGLLRRFSPQALRAAAVHGLRSDTLAALDKYAAAAGLAPGDVVTTFLNLDAEAEEAAILASPAAAAWSAAQLAAGTSLDDVMADLIEDPGLLRSWLINGEDLPGKVLSGVLGTDPQSLRVRREEGSELVALLEAKPALLALVRDLVFPSQRLRLLRLALAHPEWSLASQLVRDALPGLLDSPDTEAALALMLDEHLSYAQARIALDLRPDKAGRALLRALGPLLPSDDLFAVAAEHGTALARDVAVLEQTRPGTAAVVRSRGSRWLPVLAGPAGGAVAALLARLRCPGPAVSGWLRAAGEDGLIELGRHGQDLLTLVQQTDPHPADAKLLGHLLRLGGGAAAYHVIVKHGVPYQHWPAVVARSGEPPEDILLALWSSDGWTAAARY